jgi:FMN-dependent NADH-azoreductase
VFASRTPQESRTDEQNAALALAATLTDELVAADALLLAAPLHTTSAFRRHFKAWVDMVVTDLRMAAGAEPSSRESPPYS